MQLNWSKLAPVKNTNKILEPRLNVLTNTATINDQPVDTNRRWKKYSYTIDSLPSGNVDVFIYLYDPYQTTSTSGFNAMYYDSISFEYENIDSDGNRSEFFKI